MPMLAKLGCIEDSYRKLRDLVQNEPVRLARSLKIALDDNIFLIRKNLVPTSKYWLERFSLQVIEQKDHVTVIRKVRQINLFFIHKLR